MKQQREETAPQASSPASPAAFSREQLATAKRFAAWQRDILHAVLAPDKLYTIDQAEQAIQIFVNGSAD